MKELKTGYFTRLLTRTEGRGPIYLYFVILLEDKLISPNDCHILTAKV